MNKFVVGIVIVTVIGLGVVIAGANRSSSVPKQSFASFQSDMNAGAILYDVRTPSEYSVGHFNGAENLPLQDVQSGKLPDVAKDTKLYVYCQSGNRSRRATQLLQAAGFTSVTDLGSLNDIQKQASNVNHRM